MTVLRAGELMAKGKPKGRPKLPESELTPRKALVLQMRGSEEWKAWAEGLAEFDGLSVASVVDRAMRAYAKQIGYTKEPPKR